MVFCLQISPTKPCLHLSSPPYVPQTLHISFLFDIITRLINGEYCRSWSISLCSFVQSPSILSHLVPYIFLGTLLFSDTLSLLSFLIVRDKVSHPHKRTRKVTRAYVFIVGHLRIWTEWWQAFPEFSLLVISSWMEFLIFRVAPRNLNFPHFKRIYFLCAFSSHSIYFCNQSSCWQLIKFTVCTLVS